MVLEMLHRIGKNIIHKCIRIGFEPGMASTCIFKHPERGISVVIHGDDFTALGKYKDLDWYRGKIQDCMQTKVKGRIGPGDHDLKTMRVLNRIVEWTPKGITYEADQRHAEIISQELGLKEKSKRGSDPRNQAEDK